MIKCEVLTDTVIAVKKGSIVFVNEKQFELAKRVLKPVEHESQAEAPVKEKRTKKK